MSEDIDSKIWPSLEAINGVLKCAHPHAGSGGAHWWYNDHDEIERQLEAGEETDYVPIACKTCGEKARLSVEADEYPAI